MSRLESGGWGTPDGVSHVTVGFINQDKDFHYILNSELPLEGFEQGRSAISFHVKKDQSGCFERIDNRALLSVIIQRVMNKDWNPRDQVEGSCDRQMGRVYSLKIYLGNRVSRTC